MKKAPQVRRRPDSWDRLKLSALMIFILAVLFISRVNAPFTTPAEAFGELLVDFWWLFALLILEWIRQIHYLIAEHNPDYNAFWTDSVFGEFERGLHRRFSPWFRYRISRYVKIFFFLLILGVIANALGDQWNSPLEALVGLPLWILENIAQIIQFVFFMFIVVAQFALIFWFLSRGGVKYVMPEEIETSYDDVWGQDHVLELVKENMGFLEKPDEIESKGGYVPGGILLWGPPGTGKTLLAEATAGQVGVPFVFVEPGAFINMFFGVGILKVKGLFRKLRRLSLRHGGVVAFFDEADSLGSRGQMAQPGGGFGQPYQGPASHTMCNGPAYLGPPTIKLLSQDPGLGGSAHSDVEEQKTPIHKVIMGAGMGGGGMGTLQALLTELSGLKQPRGITNRIRKMLGMRPKPPPKYRIFIMMASNMPNALDPALLRPGRIDRIYKVGYPSKEGRLATFRGYFDKVENNLTRQQLEDLAVKTPYYSGAKIKDLVNEALILAMRDDRQVIEWDDVWRAKTLKEVGPAEGFQYVDKEEFAVAIHEASHAVAAHLLMSHADIDIATIERRGDVGGFVAPIPLEDRFTTWKSEMEVDMKVSLASLAGERLFFEGDNSSGVTGDLATATAVASRMIGIWGMGETIGSMLGLPETVIDQPPDPTDEISRSMRSQVEETLRRRYDEVAALLEEHRDKVLAVAMALQEMKTISGDDIAEIMGSEIGVLTREAPTGWGKVDPDEERAAHDTGLDVGGNGEVVVDGSGGGAEAELGAHGEATISGDGEVVHDASQDSPVIDEEVDPV